MISKNSKVTLWRRNREANIILRNFISHIADKIKNIYISKIYQINNIELMEIVLSFFAFANNSSAFSVEFPAAKCILSSWTLKNWDAFCWLRCEGANLQSSNSNPAGCNIQHRIRNYCLKSSFCYAKSLLAWRNFWKRSMNMIYIFSWELSSCSLRTQNIKFHNQYFLLRLYMHIFMEVLIGPSYIFLSTS